MHPAQLRDAASVRVSLAFWGAVEALESRAEILTSLDMGKTDAAKTALEDADILRRLAMRDTGADGQSTQEARAVPDERSNVTKMR